MEELDELDRDKLRNEQIKMMTGPCMISFSIPLMVPGITLTLVAFSDETGFSKYSVLHVIGFICLTVSVTLLILGIVLKCVWKSKITPDLERHLTPRNSTMRLNGNRKVHDTRLGTVMNNIYTGTCSTNLEEDSGRSASSTELGNGIVNKAFDSSSSSECSESPDDSLSSSDDSSYSSPSSSSGSLRQPQILIVPSTISHNDDETKVFRKREDIDTATKVTKPSKVISVKPFDNTEKAFDNNDFQMNEIVIEKAPENTGRLIFVNTDDSDKPFENKSECDNLPIVLSSSKSSSSESLDKSDKILVIQDFQTNETVSQSVQEMSKSSDTISIMSLDNSDEIIGDRNVQRTETLPDIELNPLPEVVNSHKIPFNSLDDSDNVLDGTMSQVLPEVQTLDKKSKKLKDRKQFTEPTVESSDIETRELPTIPPPSYASVVYEHKSEKKFSGHRSGNRETIPIVEDTYSDNEHSNNSLGDDVTPLSVYEDEQRDKDDHTVDVVESFHQNNFTEPSDVQHQKEDMPEVRPSLFTSPDTKTDKIGFGVLDIDTHESVQKIELERSGQNYKILDIDSVTHKHLESGSDTSSVTSGMSDSDMSEDSVLAQYKNTKRT